MPYENVFITVNEMIVLPGAVTDAVIVTWRLGNWGGVSEQKIQPDITFRSYFLGFSKFLAYHEHSIGR